MRLHTPCKFAFFAAAVAALGIAPVGCAQRPASVTHRAPAVEEALAITQVGYGARATYVTCPLSGCSRPTPKTIIEPHAPERPEPPAMLAAAPEPVTEAPVPAPAPEPAPVTVLEPTKAAPVEAVPVPMAAPAATDTPEAPVVAKALEDRRVFVSFPIGSARLSPEARTQLDRLAPRVQGAERVVIRGRTDERGDSDTNDRLALRRAMAVYAHLKRAAQVSGKPFQLLAKGACCYVAPNDSEEGRAANRRAEIDIVLPLQASAIPPRRITNKARSS